MDKMEIQEFIMLKEIQASASSFLNSIKIGDKVCVDMGNDIYREATIKSDPYPAPSGATYITVTVFNKILSKSKDYAVPIWDLYPLGSKQIIYDAYIYSLNRLRGTSYSRQGDYELVCEGKRIKMDYCYGRKDANKKLLDSNMLKSYGINRVYSNGDLVYNDVGKQEERK